MEVAVRTQKSGQLVLAEVDPLALTRSQLEWAYVVYSVDRVSHASREKSAIADQCVDDDIRNVIQFCIPVTLYE